MNIKRTAIAAAIVAGTSIFTTMPVLAAEPTNQELLELIKKQQAQIELLMKKVNETDKKVNETDRKVEQADVKIESTAAAVEETMSTASAIKTHIGGYGELHYNDIEDNETFDFHRFVLFFGHEFSDKIRFYSELELEHAFIEDSDDGESPGEVELEQAYIEMDLSDNTQIKAGLFLLPVGILNETHEPPTFYGVERNPVEKEIIPATWWESGAAISTKFTEGLKFDFAVHSGLNVPTDGSKAFLVRSGRTKAAKAPGDDLAYTTRLKYTAIPGLELAASYQHQDDVTQGALDISSDLFTTHAIYNTGNFTIRALYALWDLEGIETEILGRDEQSGYYIEPSYRLNDNWGIFARYNEWDNSAGISGDTEKKQSNVGFNYWPHENVVFKFDLENRTGAQNGSGFNLGVGYQF